MVAHHPTEPAALIPLVRKVFAHVGGRCDDDGHRVGIAAGRLGGLFDPVTVHSTMVGSASCRMNPSATWPIISSAWAHTRRRTRPERDLAAHGNLISVSLIVAVRPLPSSLMTEMLSRRVASVDGLPESTRTAESPRPMPQMVRLP